MDTVTNIASHLQADINCMSDMLNINPNWKYYLNLASQAFPLKTNSELVKILKAYNGSNDIESSMAVNHDRLVFFPSSLRLFHLLFLVLKKLRTSVLSVGQLILLFWTSGKVCTGFQSQGGSHAWVLLSPVCKRILRFTSDVTPVNLLTANIANEPF